MKRGTRTTSLCAVTLLCSAPRGTSYAFQKPTRTSVLNRQGQSSKGQHSIPSLQRTQVHWSLKASRTSGLSSEPTDTGSTAKSGWHRRVLSKVFRRHPLQMQVELSEEQATEVFSDDFVKANLEKFSPADLFAIDPGMLRESPESLWDLPEQPISLQVEETPTRSTNPNGKSTTQKNPSTVPSKEASLDAGGSPAARVTRMWYQNIVTDKLNRWSKGTHVNLNVDCLPSPFSLLKGHLRFDTIAKFDRIVFGPIRMSGGQIEAQGLAVNLWSFTPNVIPTQPPRFPNQFDFVAKNITFTQEDLFESKCIRNGLSRLLVRILKQTGVTSSTVTINSIEILPSNKIAIQGDATTSFGSSVPFQVRSGLSTSGRGHVLTFPGLEMSLGSSAAAFFVPILPQITLDLGHNAQLEDVAVDGIAQQLRVSARVSITPTHTRKLSSNYIQCTGSYAASHSVDVGRWLTRVGNFSFNSI